MNVSVGIVTRNGPTSVVRAALSALPSASEVIVINADCSPAHLKTVHAALDGKATLIDLPAGTGLVYSWNMIIRTAKSDWVVISNDDVKFDADWLAKLEQCLRECPNARHVGIAYPTNKYSCFALHKSLVADIGWFDERFTGYFFEDEDWHLRLSEFTGKNVGREWAAGKRDGVFASCDAALHDHATFREPGSGGGLSRTPNERHFKDKWAQTPDGWWTKGRVDGHYVKMLRRLPEVTSYPLPREGT